MRPEEVEVTARFPLRMFLLTSRFLIIYHNGMALHISLTFLYETNKLNQYLSKNRS